MSQLNSTVITEFSIYERAKKRLAREMTNVVKCKMNYVNHPELSGQAVHELSSQAVHKLRGIQRSIP